MEILGEEQVRQFCRSEVPEQERTLSSIVSARRPSHVLPVFQLCAEVHAAARHDQLDFAQFRACWQRFVYWHFAECADGFLVHVGDGDLDEENHARAVLELPRPDLPAPDPSVDPRDSHDEYKEHILRRRFRALHERARPRLNDLERANPGAWWGRGCPPDDLAGATYVAKETTSTVVDTNVFVEILNALPPDGNLVRFVLPRRLDVAFNRVRPVFTVPYGAAGELIVPLSVLIEAEGITAMKHEYKNARTVLSSMARNPEGVLWKVFEFEGLALDVFDAFLHLHERLAQTHVPRYHWPRLGDALVFAHGLVHGCPIASTEWTDAGNIRWRQAGIDGLFPFLTLG